MSDVLIIDDILAAEDMACSISNQYTDWEGRRVNWLAQRKEINQYIFATDTSQTSNAALPWSNKTTIPKLCQIRDNLFANYMATMFPKRKNISWTGVTREDDDAEKTKAIEAYMSWTMDRPEFYAEVAKLVLDYIDYGNAFAMPEWYDGRNPAEEGGMQYGYVGPLVRRISPLDIVFDPTATNFTRAPKIVRSVVSIGEVKEMLERDSKTPEEAEDAKALWSYLKDIREKVAAYPGQTDTKDDIYRIAGFDSYYSYLSSGTVEILTFYGDIYDPNADEFNRNQIIKVVDRHKIISQRPSPTFFGYTPIYHVGWRIRPDSLWAAGPLDNLVGMQYRIDHLENMKADVWDLTRFPVLKIKGYVEDFDWTPGARIYVGDDGDVEMLAPDVGALQANTEIAILEAKMEEMAGSPREAMGFRTPGEKTKYEVQRLENAASRIFQNKISQFERDLVEEVLNAELELSRRNLTEESIPVFDEEFKINQFMAITPADIAGNGRLRPMAARHFAEQAQLVQDINAFYSSSVGQDPNVAIHFSGERTAQMFEHLLNIEDYGIVQPYVRISEMQKAQELQMIAQEQATVTGTTASGIGDDYDVNQGSVALPAQGPPVPGAV